MPHSKMSDEMRDKIIALVQGGANWSKIQRETGIDRRTVKNAYQKWERNSSVKELQEVRREIAAVEFRTHMDSMVTLATTLVSNIGLPSSIKYAKRNSQEFFDWFWQQDLLLRYSGISQATDPSIGNRGFIIEDQKIYYDEKKLLFKSLREHTQGEVQWSVLDEEWENAMDKCAKIVPDFLKETRRLVDSHIKVANDRGFLEKVKRVTKKSDPAKNITEAIANVIWRSITRRELNKENLPSFETITRDKSENVNVITIRSGDEILFSFFGEGKQYLAENIKQTCNAAIKGLSVNKTVWELDVEAGNIRKASDDLRRMLNPLKLRPLILRTRCELCPVH